MKFQIQLPDEFRAKYVVVEVAPEGADDATTVTTQPLAEKYADIWVAEQTAELVKAELGRKTNREWAERAEARCKKLVDQLTIAHQTIESQKGGRIHQLTEMQAADHRTIVGLRADRTMQRNRAELAETKLKELETKLTDAQAATHAEAQRARAYDEDRKTERARAEQAERLLIKRDAELAAAIGRIESQDQTIGALERRLTERRARIDELFEERSKFQRAAQLGSDRLDKVRGTVWTDRMNEALADYSDPADYASHLAEAVEAVRRVIGTSQA
jgi:chromosome segregation ATPase